MFDIIVVSMSYTIGLSTKKFQNIVGNQKDSITAMKFGSQQTTYAKNTIKTILEALVSSIIRILIPILFFARFAPDEGRVRLTALTFEAWATLRTTAYKVVVITMGIIYTATVTVV